MYMATDYKGRPYRDSNFSGGPQIIPGRVLCAYFDFGGEGVAYHDSDSVNHGSGRLNPPDGTYLNEFRIDEGVDTTYVKYRDDIDNNPYNYMEPEKDMLYVGWTEPGEWLKYSVEVKKTGEYSINLMYTSNRGGAISLSFDDTDLTGPIPIKTTYREEDPIEWRQWHHWNKTDEIAKILLTEGFHVCTLHTVENGQMNYAYLEFELLE
jgi:hypothetical protein